MLAACAFEPVTAEASEHVNLGQKVRTKIESCNVCCFVLTPRDRIEGSNEYKCPDWLLNEIGIAYGKGKKFAVFVETTVSVGGLTQYVEDYTRFERSSLNDEIPKILGSLLSLRLPSLHEALTVLFAENRVAPVNILSSLKRVIQLAKQIKEMTAAVSLCSIVALVKDSSPILVIDKGKRDGIVTNSVWRVLHVLPGSQGIEIEVGKAVVSYLQEDMSHLQFSNPGDVGRLKDVTGSFEADGSSLSLKDWVVRPENLPFLAGATVDDLDRFINVVDELLQNMLSQG